MKTFTIYFLCFAGLLSTISCSKKNYLTSDYNRYAKNHKIVAVLPYSIKITGRATEKMEKEEIEAIEMEESLLFQKSLYHEVLMRTGHDDNDIVISVLDVNKTNRLLKEGGIDFAEIDSYTPKMLGEILQVDAIISSRVEKQSILSRQESFIVDAASTVILDKFPLPTNQQISRGKLSRSSSVDVYCSIVDVDSETAVWVIHQECEAQWDDDPDDVIEGINRSISKNFPYKKEKRKNR